MAVLSYREAEEKKAGKPVEAPPPIASLPETEVIAEPPEEKPKAKPRPDDPWFRFEHPDMTRSHRPSGTLSIVVDGVSEEVTVSLGRVETQSPDIRDELIRMGYRWMNERFGQ